MKEITFNFLLSLSLMLTLTAVPNTSEGALVIKNALSEDAERMPKAFEIGISTYSGFLIGATLATGFLGFAWVGIVFLDEDGASKIQFTTMDEEGAQALGLTFEELAAYNENVDIFNAIMDELRTLPDESDFEMLWEQFASDLNWNTDTWNSLNKVSAHLRAAFR